MLDWLRLHPLKFIFLHSSNHQSWISMATASPFLYRVTDIWKKFCIGYLFPNVSFTQWNPCLILHFEGSLISSLAHSPKQLSLELTQPQQTTCLPSPDRTEAIHELLRLLAAWLSTACVYTYFIFSSQREAVLSLSVLIPPFDHGTHSVFGEVQLAISSTRGWGICFDKIHIPIADSIDLIIPLILLFSLVFGSVDHPGFFLKISSFLGF